MKIEELRQRSVVNQDAVLHRMFSKYDSLLTELRSKDLPDDVVAYINKGVEQVNAAPDYGLKVKISAVQREMLKMLEDRLRIVTKKHYQRYWMPLGVGYFGVPIGIIWGLAVGNIGLMGIGMPVGMVFGIAYGAFLDKKAMKEGRVLDVDAKR